MKTIDIKGKEYVLVNERIKYFRENFKNWSLSSEIVSLENGVCVIKATVKDENEVIKATGFAYEKEGSTFINKTSYIENCETSAWGRALGNLGIGIDTSIASAEEVQNAVLNQESKPKKYIPKETSKGFEGATSKDLDIYLALNNITDIDEVKSFYEVNKDNVVNPKEFNSACNTKIRQLKEVKEKFGNIPLEEVPF